MTENVEWNTTDIHILDNLSRPDGFRNRFNYKIFNNNEYEIIGITELRYDTLNKSISHTIQLPFNISTVEELYISKYESGIAGPIDYSIFYDNNINSILIVTNSSYGDYWDGYVWKICGKL